MRLTVLGCSGPFPRAGEATSGYLLETEKGALLLDCGSGILSRLTQYMDPRNLLGILLTHLHFDHMSDTGIYGYLLAGQMKKMPLFVPPEEESDTLKLLSLMPAYDIQKYEDTQHLNDIQIRTFPTRHPVPNRALSIECEGKKLVYTGDTAEGNSLVSFCKDADLLLADAAFLKEERKESAPHMSAFMAASLAEASHAKKLILTHFSPSAIPQLLLKEARDVFPETEIAVPSQQLIV